jgi:hypothetical protein
VPSKIVCDLWRTEQDASVTSHPFLDAGSSLEPLPLSRVSSEGQGRSTEYHCFERRLATHAAAAPKDGGQEAQDVGAAAILTVIAAAAAAAL